ncbi:hypothetical protein QNA23_10720 [Rhodococcus erythropolis]|uniref:hypothetical protein n=1 Tax=Rhodococcus erythropolis TaxID=1833 RepID=UPI0024B87C5E|nr:hypothetical protein [Rhodococcus erythropolis]MDJ0403955.1 hypothetical protein [Rhodococcus erythropolis]
MHNAIDQYAILMLAAEPMIAPEVTPTRGDELLHHYLVPLFGGTCNPTPDFGDGQAGGHLALTHQRTRRAATILMFEHIELIDMDTDLADSHNSYGYIESYAHFNY